MVYKGKYWKFCKKKLKFYKNIIEFKIGHF